MLELGWAGVPWTPRNLSNQTTRRHSREQSPHQPCSLTDSQGPTQLRDQHSTRQAPHLARCHTPGSLAPASCRDIPKRWLPSHNQGSPHPPRGPGHRSSAPAPTQACQGNRAEPLPQPRPARGTKRSPCPSPGTVAGIWKSLSSNLSSTALYRNQRPITNPGASSCGDKPCVCVCVCPRPPHRYTGLCSSRVTPPYTEGPVTCWATHPWTQETLPHTTGTAAA